MKKLLVLLAFTSLINPKGFTQTSPQNILALALTAWVDFHCLLLENVKGMSHIAYAGHSSYTAKATSESIMAGKGNYRSWRNYTSSQAAVKEAAISKLYGGIPYRYSIAQGFVLEECVPRFVERPLIFHLPH